MFDAKKPTVLLLGRWQPWHDGHLALFKRAISKTGQVVIQVRDVKDSSGGEGQDDNPFSFSEISHIHKMLDYCYLVIHMMVHKINDYRIKITFTIFTTDQRYYVVDTVVG